MGKSKRKSKGKKAPGIMSFVVWRQLVMVLAAPGAATSLLPLFGPEANFMVAVVAVAIPSLVHGQLWKWSYDWHNRGPATRQKLRLGQIALGVLHCGIVGFALFRVATGETPWQGAGFFYGLAIAGLIAGAWETVRPALELREQPAKADAPSSEESSG